ncbi:MAG: hypothetical protein M3264_14765, partial [Thermoproteota archaeon]|nr:hypothetical protein [Thermoproteota archaeon]
MVIIPKAFFITAIAAILISSTTSVSYQQVQLLFDDEEDVAVEEEEEDVAVEEEEEDVAVEEEEEDVA